jgi:hypothetical protein
LHLLLQHHEGERRAEALRVAEQARERAQLELLQESARRRELELALLMSSH